MPEPPSERGPGRRTPPDEDRTFWSQYARYGQIGFVLPAAVVAGWLIGAALDRWLHTQWLYLVGLLLGVVAGFVELIRLLIHSESDE